jgi:Peptidase family M23
MLNARSAVLAIGLTLGTGQMASAEDVLAPLVVIPVAKPQPVLAADAKQHLAYELMLVNLAGTPVALKKIEALDAASDRALYTLEGDGLAQMLKLNGGAKGTELPGSGSGILFLDLTLPKDATLPKALKHRFDIEVANPAAGGDKQSDRDPAPAPKQDIVFTTDALVVGPGAIAVAPPLKGKRWVVGGGCCAPPSYHRGATLPINGAIHVAERFAIDFVQLNDSNMLFDGDMKELADYAYFGDEIYSATNGTVVAVEDGLPEQVPGKLPEGATMQMAAGNHVVVDIGGGRYAFYAHMQPGSLKVKIGDQVSTGQALGLLGNSGNTDSPHLHFHIMDGPSPLLSNGLPFVFTSFSGEGRVVDEDPLFKGGTVTVDKDALSGPHKNQMPLLDQVVSFP